MAVNPLKQSPFYLLVVSIGIFCLLVKLGFWQLSQAEKKQQLQRQMTLRQQGQPLTFETLLSKAGEPSLTGYRLQVTAKPAMDKVLLLDNQVFEGQVGYLAYQLVEVSPALPWLLLELGFVAGSKNRAELPQVRVVETEQKFNGRLYQKQSNPLSHQLMAEEHWPKRVQNIHTRQLSELLQHPILPVVLQPDSLPNSALPHPWKPLPMPARKHQGYAVQWFAMALVFGLLTLKWAWPFSKKRRKMSKSKETGEE